MKTLWVPKIILNIPALHNYLSHRQEDRSPSGYSFSLVLLYISLPLCVSLFCSVLILTCPPEGLLWYTAPGDLAAAVIKFSLTGKTICPACTGVWHCCAVNFRYLISHYQPSSDLHSAITPSQALQAYVWTVGLNDLYYRFCRSVWTVCLWCSTICRYSWRFSEGTWLNECRRSIHKTSWRLSPLNREGVLVTHKLWVRIWNF